MNEGSSAKQQIVDGIKANSNILITVSDSPNVDELSAALGLTMLLNKIDKRATAIFSGDIPLAITFLDPSKTFESTIDSLRDFIIALDKEKADHLRYKVDGDVVKIFITPYKTTLTDKDLSFSQGDYNVEMVIALGVRDQEHLDHALSAHGRILHDALVTTISIGENNSLLGSIDWRDAMASSYCEVLVSLAEALKEDTPILDQQIATALLTGIVAATDRFSNDRTSSRVMTMAAQLMAAGADQQLIAAKLQEQHAIKAEAPAPASEPAPIAAPEPQQPVDDAVPGGEAVVNLAGGDRPKKEKKKKDDTAMRIEREPKRQALKTIEPISDPDTIKPEAIMTPAQEANALADAAAVDAAMDQAGVHDSLEQSLASTVTPSTPDTNSLEQELAAAMQTGTTPPSVSSLEAAMPGFEALDAPAPAAPLASTISSSIQGHSGGDYVTTGAAASSFDMPVNAMPENGDGGTVPGGAAVVDPFAVPLPPLPVADDTTQSLMTQADLTQPFVPPTSDFTATATPADDQVSGQVAPIDPSMTPLTPLPPLPDFSTLPPLPGPDMPPLFDQPPAPLTAMPSGAIEPEKLGDIFSDAVATPAPKPPAPASPGQFQIPGQ